MSERKAWFSLAFCDFLLAAWNMLIHYCILSSFLLFDVLGASVALSIAAASMSSPRATKVRELVVIISLTAQPSQM